MKQIVLITLKKAAVEILIIATSMLHYIKILLKKSLRNLFLEKFYFFLEMSLFYLTLQ